MKRFLALLAALCLLAMVGASALGEDAEDYGPFASGNDAAQPPQKGLEVYYFDIGRVDAILIRCDGACAFIDVGFRRDARPTLAYLKALGVDKLDYYIGTHAHADHVAGAAAIIDALKPERVLIPHRKVWSAILADASKAQKSTCEAIGYTVLKHGEIFPLGGADIKCLGPVRVVSCGIGDLKENDNSLIFRMIYGAHTFLFTGDTSDSVLRAVDRNYPGELRADVFKNPHHNGAHGDDIVALVQPKVTVFCTDNGSQPAGKYLRALKRAGSETYITGSHNDGNVLVTSDGVNLQVCRGYGLKALSLDPVSETLAVGQTLKLTGSMESLKKTKPGNWLSWLSSDPGVAKVSGGVVAAVSEGTATITATSINGLSAAVEVRVAAVGLALDRGSLVMKAGEIRQLQATASAPGEDSAVAWMSEDSAVATVDSNGEVRAVGEGETRVIARLPGGAEASCRVAVVRELASAVKLDHTSLSLSLGRQIRLNASVSPAEASGQLLEWASSDESVATVDATGLVTAVGKGEARIGVRAADGVYALCRVRVK